MSRYNEKGRLSSRPLRVYCLLPTAYCLLASYQSIVALTLAKRAGSTAVGRFQTGPKVLL